MIRTAIKTLNQLCLNVLLWLLLTMFSGAVLTDVEDRLLTSSCLTYQTSLPSLNHSDPVARPEVFTDPGAAVAAGRLAGAGAGQVVCVLLELAAVTAVEGVYLHVDVLTGVATGGRALGGLMEVRLGGTEGVERGLYGGTLLVASVHLRPRH